jgi:hypothetical protein
MNTVKTLLTATRSTVDDLILGLRNQTVSIKSENTVLKKRNVMWIRVNETGRITGQVKRGDALIDVVYAPGKGQWYTLPTHTKRSNK